MKSTTFLNFWTLVLTAVFHFTLGPAAYAQAPGTLLKATLQRTVGTNELNAILGPDKTKFATTTNSSYVVPIYPSAAYAVDIFKISYSSRIPEQRNRKTVAYGMIAIPRGADARYPRNPKLISYQHGTIFGKYQCPSYAFATNNPQIQGLYWDGGYEDRLVTAVFAGQGDVVIAADYFGIGDSVESEGYTVKGSHQQACLDFYLAASSFLSNKGIRPTGLFLSGWSQGGLVTLQFLEKLEQLGYQVTAASTAAAPSDPFAAMNGLIYNPSPIQANWANIMLILTVFSYEKYYSQPGLAKEVLDPKYYGLCKQVYERKGTNSLENTYSILFGTNTNTSPPTSIPADYWDLVQSKYHDPVNLATSTYGKYLDQNQGYRWFSFTPIRMYYGLVDEVVTVPVALLPLYYDQALGNTNITSHSVTGGNHRGTFLRAVSEQKTWFDTFTGTP
jgi:hypothetical protein